MVDPPALQGMAQRAHDDILADQIVEAARTPLARQHQMRAATVWCLFGYRVIGE